MKRKIFSLFPVMGLMLALFVGNFRAVALERPATPVTTEINANSTIEQIREELKAMDVYVLDFQLKDGAFPTFDVVTPPEGCNGLSITNNEYVTGKLDITFKGDKVYRSGEWVKKTSGVKVKARGNTSTAHEWIQKKGYKVKLEKKADLLFRDGSDGKDKEWVLLGQSASVLNFVPGFQLGRVCGLGWQPELRHVAVIMNDKYVGCYYLAEAVGAGKHKVDIDDSGYIVENDAYWWKPGEVYFKSNHQILEMGWTFKEPDTDDFDEMSLDNIKWTINSLEKNLYNGEPVEDMIDYDSFARWVLAQDIMNSVDPCGTNIFVKKKDFNPLSPFESKLQMGPLWDFDGCFVSGEERFSLIHTYSVFWFRNLFEKDEFNNIYSELWKEIRPTLKDKVMSVVENYISQNPDYFKLLMIDDKRGVLNAPLVTPYDAYENLSNWFDKRIPVLNKLILGEDSGIVEVNGSDVSADGNGAGQGEGLYYTVDGLPTTPDAEGTLIHVEPNGKTSKIRK
ncbi:MAG: CotH kinase family protein [Muribaculaceae bacterium]|nr:CotH kinase family protein [Muribaculaceae bacterium]